MSALEYLKNYNGEPLCLMEVCGTHTAEINRNGIRHILPPAVRLVSGPGCPVCVTVSAYIDRLIELGRMPGNQIVTFGDLLRVPGTRLSLAQARAEGCRARMVYSPLDVLGLARADASTTFIFAAVGFETTTPVYAMLLRHVIEEGLHNVRLLTSLKVMPPVIEAICRQNQEGGSGIQGFLAPGHVSVITGSRIYEPLAARYGIPFVVSGFTGEQLIASIAALVKLRGQGRVVNLYPSAVTREGNLTAQAEVNRYFTPCAAAWRGLGVIEGSGLKLREEYAAYDAGSENLFADGGGNPACQCARVLTGRIDPPDCALYGSVCTPQTPQGACMVSSEGSCFNAYMSM